MRGKQFLFLIIILIALLAAVVYVKRPPEPTKLAHEVGFERVLPTSITAEAIHGIDLYQGEKKDDAVKLRRQGDAWVAASYHNAPVKADKVSKLLDGVGSLEGDVRADKADVLNAFNLQDAQALHVLLYMDKSDEPQAHLLAGKSSGRSEFVRRADQNRVYSVDFNLRSEAGLYGDDTDKTPEAKPWLNLQIHDVPENQVTRVELQLPERRIQLALNKPAPEKPVESKKSENGEAKAEDEPKPAAPAKAMWELVEPKVDYALKQGAIEGLVRALRTLRGDDVVASDKAAEYGLDSPPYRALLTLEEEGKEPRQVAIAVGKTVSEEDEKRYVRLESDKSPVYLLPKWSFNQAFPTLGAILTLDILDLSSDDIVRVGWEQDGTSLALERQPTAEAGASEGSGEAKADAPEAKADAWRWAQAPDVEVDAEKLETLFGAIERVTADDWLPDIPAEAGLEKPTMTMSVTLRDGSTRRVAFGQTRGKDEDRYVGLEGKAGVFVIAKVSYTSIADALKPLRPEPPAPAEAPAPESAPKPAAADAKPEISGAEPAVKPTVEETSITLPKPREMPPAPATLPMPMPASPAPPPLPKATLEAEPAETEPVAPATGAESAPPNKAEQ